MASLFNMDVDNLTNFQPKVLLERIQEHPNPPTQERFSSPPFRGFNTPEEAAQKLFETSVEQNRSRALEALDAQTQAIKTKKNEVNRKADRKIAQLLTNLSPKSDVTLHTIYQLLHQNRKEPAGSTHIPHQPDSPTINPPRELNSTAVDIKINQLEVKMESLFHSILTRLSDQPQPNAPQNTTFYNHPNTTFNQSKGLNSTSQNHLPHNSSVEVINQNAKLANDRSKALNRLLSNTSNIFNGNNPVEFLPWKESINREVEDLDLSASQLLQLLHARTSGIARVIIEQVKVIQIEVSPEEALKFAWEILSKRFHTQKRPIQQLVQDILNGPIITPQEPDSVFIFAQKCAIAINLRESFPRVFAPLEEDSNFNSIIGRLHHDIAMDWHQHRRLQLADHSVVPFALFASWIDTQSQVYLDNLKVAE